MATTLFPTDTASTYTNSTWTHSPVTKLLSLSRGAGIISKVDNTVASLAVDPIAATSAVAPWGAAASFTGIAGFDDPPASTILWVSNPLNAVTISGTITVNIRALESSGNANYGVGVEIYQGNGSGSGGAKIGVGDLNTELGALEAARNFTLTPTSTALSAGDVIVIMLVYFSAGGTSASGFTATGRYAGASGATGDTFVTFTETITEQTTVTTPPSPFVVDTAVDRAANY